MTKIKVRPTDLLHGEIYLTSQIVISPKEGWRELPFDSTMPKSESQKAEWTALMRKVDFYYQAGKLELNFRKPSKITKPTDPFWCTDPNGNHPGIQYPATYGKLCSYCFNHSSPDELYNRT